MLVAFSALVYGWGIGSEGWGNLYYSAAVRSMGQSWSGFWFATFDPLHLSTTDKPPLSLWVQVAAVRVLGFHGWVLLAPQVVAGAASVWLLYLAVSRWAGHAAGFIAAAVLAVTPIVVAINRDNNPDTLLMFLLVAAVYATTRALGDDGFRWLGVAAVAVALGALTKSLTAWMVVPSIGLAYLVGGPVELRRRVARLALVGLIIVAGSLAWPAAVDLSPKSQRPIVEGSPSDSELNLMLVADGINRLKGGTNHLDAQQLATANRNTGVPGPLRLFGPQFGGQIGWLLVAGGVCSATGLWVSWRRRRSPLARAGWLLWVTWLTVAAAVVSLGGGVGHLYYASELAPALGAVVGAGAVLLWQAWWAHQRIGWMLPVGLGAQTVVAAGLARREAGSFPWLSPVILATGGAAVCLLLLSRGVFAEWGAAHKRRRGFAISGLALIALAAGPVAWSYGPLTAPTNGNDPRGGPGRRPASSFTSVDVVRPALARLEAQGAGRRYQVLLPSTMEAGAWIVAGADRVAGLGGYTGNEGTPSGAVLREWLNSGQIGFVLINRATPNRGSARLFTFWCRNDASVMGSRSVPGHHYHAYWCGPDDPARQPQES